MPVIGLGLGNVCVRDVVFGDVIQHLSSRQTELQQWITISPRAENIQYCRIESPSCFMEFCPPIDVSLSEQLALYEWIKLFSWVLLPCAIFKYYLFTLLVIIFRANASVFWCSFLNAPCSRVQFMATDPSQQELLSCVTVMWPSLPIYWSSNPLFLDPVLEEPRTAHVFVPTQLPQHLNWTIGNELNDQEQT